MAKMEYLNKVQQFKNAIDTYSGPDPLKPRYEYIMWLEKSVGKENSEVDSCLGETLQRFQNDPRYTNDFRFVELLILFTRLKGDKLGYFKRLYETELGGKCAIFYKAWSDQLVLYKKYLDAFEVLKQGLLNQAEPAELLKKAQGDIGLYVGLQILNGKCCCELLKRSQCSSTSTGEQKNEVVEIPAVKNWEFNSLKPGQKDEFTVPLLIAEPDDENKRRMYPRHLVYNENSEFQLEELGAFKYYQKLQAQQQNVNQNSSTGSSFKGNQQAVGENDVSLAAQSLTAHSKLALNLVQGMWESPNPSGKLNHTKENFRIPDVPKAVGATPLTVYNDSIHQETQNAGSSRGCTVTKSSQKGGGLSERKPVPVELMSEGAGCIERNVKHQLVFGGSSQDSGRDGAVHIGRTAADDELAIRLEPPTSPSRFSSNQQANDWNLDDVTCNTRVFNKFIPISSTPNMKLKEKNEHFDQPGCSSAKCQGEALSTILEASKETPSSASSNNENKPPNILDVEKSLENLEINTNDPFCPKLLERFLLKINYPYNVEPSLLQNFNILNTRLPNITKTLKLGDHVYSLTGESFKGAYAKVLKVTCDNQTYGLKIEKPSSHWEYYICKEIRKRVNPDLVKYFADITGAYFYQNGSILVLNWAKYGTVLNVINQTKLSSQPMDTPVKLFFCIEVLSAIHYLHSHCNIIHADVKPDNFVVHNLPNLNSCGRYVQLIDFGRSIDMRLMPKDTKFTTVVKTDGFQCNEMKENKPWTYQTDLYGLAGTMYCILAGDYMKVIKKKDIYVLSRPLLRPLQALWNPIFMDLLNIESCDALPDLGSIKKTLEENYNSYDPFPCRNAFNTLANILHGN